jgi:hypothetical protein
LIANAIQAMPGGGELTVHIRHAMEWTTHRHGNAMYIFDTGTGIRKEDAKRLFEPFYSTKLTKGTGLGLWISKGIIQKYGGNITFRCFAGRNKSMTCFRVFIPVTGGQNTTSAAGSDQEKTEREKLRGNATTREPVNHFRVSNGELPSKVTTTEKRRQRVLLDRAG